MLTKSQIEEIKKRAERAPQFEFGPERIDHDDGTINYELNENGNLIVFSECDFINPMRAKFGSDFYFHSLTDIPNLIETVEELQKLAAQREQERKEETRVKRAGRDRMRQHYEKQLAEAKDKINRLNEIEQAFRKLAGKFEKERDEAREEIEELKRCHEAYLPFKEIKLP